MTIARGAEDVVVFVAHELQITELVKLRVLIEAEIFHDVKHC